ncbi:MAG: hypothetical protein HKO98_01605 [Gemmatimonadetes bacterium]|nr:hypothetical protein [Gemmatimonadota bacterium]
MSSSNARRFAVEALVIIASILIAFALDAWWDNRQERARIAELLSAVADDFEREVAVLDSIVAANRGRYVVETAFLRATDAGAATVSADSIARLAAMTEDHQIYDPSFGALSALLSSGGLESVDDPDLRRRLAGWPAELLDLEWEQRQAFDAVDGVLESLIQLGLMSRVESIDEYWPTRVEASLRSPSHRERESLLNLMYRLYTDDLVRIRRRAVDLAARIRSYLEGA